MIDKASTQAKVQYAKQMYSASGLEYVFIPSKYADMILQEFIEHKNANYVIQDDFGLLTAASPDC